MKTLRKGISKNKKDLFSGLVVGVIFLLIHVYSISAQNSFVKNLSQTQGRIVGYEEYNFLEHCVLNMGWKGAMPLTPFGSSVSCYTPSPQKFPIIEFKTASSEKITFLSYVTIDERNDPNEITVYYNSENPKMAQLFIPEKSGFSLITFSLLFLVGFVTGVVIYHIVSFVKKFGIVVYSRYLKK